MNLESERCRHFAVMVSPFPVARVVVCPRQERPHPQQGQLEQDETRLNVRRSESLARALGKPDRPTRRFVVQERARRDYAVEVLLRRSGAGARRGAKSGRTTTRGRGRFQIRATPRRAATFGAWQVNAPADSCIGSGRCVGTRRGFRVVSETRSGTATQQHRIDVGQSAGSTRGRHRIPA